MSNAYQSIKFSKSLRSSAFILGAIALWVLLPFYFGADSTVSRAESVVALAVKCDYAWLTIAPVKAEPTL